LGMDLEVCAWFSQTSFACLFPLLNLLNINDRCEHSYAECLQWSSWVAEPSMVCSMPGLLCIQLQTPGLHLKEAPVELIGEVHNAYLDIGSLLRNQANDRQRTPNSLEREYLV
jgi:hypothetical protein